MPGGQTLDLLIDCSGRIEAPPVQQVVPEIVIVALDGNSRPSLNRPQTVAKTNLSTLNGVEKSARTHQIAKATQAALVRLPQNKAEVSRECRMKPISRIGSPLPPGVQNKFFIR